MSHCDKDKSLRNELMNLAKKIDEIMRKLVLQMRYMSWCDGLESLQKKGSGVGRRKLNLLIIIQFISLV